VVETSSASESDAIGLNPASQASVTEAFVQSYGAALDVPVGWTGSVSGCVAGAPSAAGQEATFTAINFVRQLAGLPVVTEDASESERTQATALMLQAKGELSHTRDTSWPCATEAGIDKYANSANFEILAPYAGAEAIAPYIKDAGEQNRPLGHRAAILGSWMWMGSGSTHSYNAIRGGRPNATAALPATWSWPSAGYVPYQLAEATAPDWSFYLRAGSLASATVSVTKNGQAVTVSDVRQVDGWYDTGWTEHKGLAWVMPTLEAPAAGAVDTYHVTITGITGGTCVTESYDVKLFTVPAVVVGTVTNSGTLQVGKSLTLYPTGWSPADATFTYQWYRGSGWGDLEPIVGATSASYTFTAADAGRRIAFNVRGQADGLLTGVYGRHMFNAAVAAAAGSTTTPPASTGPVATPGAGGTGGTGSTAGGGGTSAASAAPSGTGAAGGGTGAGGAASVATPAVTPQAAPVALTKVTLKSAKAGKRRITVKWRKAPAGQLVTGYQVAYRVKGARAWTTVKVKGAGAASKVLTKLAKGKKYQVRVRSYRQAAGAVTQRSAWSTIRTTARVK
jgi:hypothetical protein